MFNYREQTGADVGRVKSSFDLTLGTAAGGKKLYLRVFRILIKHNGICSIC